MDTDVHPELSMGALRMSLCHVRRTMTSEMLSFGAHRPTEAPPTRDHFIPLALGGDDHIGNIVLSCGLCNQLKGDRFPSVAEMSKWNDLASCWPYIKMFEVAPTPPAKYCSLCFATIPPERVREFRELKHGTSTCSRVCSNRARKVRWRRRMMLRLNASQTLG